MPKTKYPQGAEKMLIKRVTGRKVPSGGLPADVGCVVGNISTTKAIADAIQKGMPLVERVVTVTGERLKNPGNFIVKIGTNTKDLIDYCGGIIGDDVTVKAGGPMMGFVLSDTERTDHERFQRNYRCGYRSYGGAAVYQVRPLYGCMSHGAVSPRISRNLRMRRTGRA